MIHTAKHSKLSKLLFIFVTAVLLAAPLLVRADPISDFADVQRKLSAKAGEAKTLSDQLAVLDETIQAKTRYLTEASVRTAVAKRRLEAINRELSDLQDQQQNTQIQLDRFVRADYVAGRPNEYSVIAGAGSLSDALASGSYTGSLEERANKEADRLQKITRQAEQRRTEARDTYQSLDQLAQEAARQTSELQSVRDAKNRLLADTRGQEETFRQQFEASKEQLVKLGLFARSARDRIGSRIWDDSGFYFNQLDSRWADGHLGFSNSSTIGDYGCGLTSLAMVYKYYGLGGTPLELNERLKHSGAFIDDLMDWRNAAAASGGQLTLANNPYPIGRDNVDWGLIDRQLTAGNPVIVYIDRANAMSHYVLLVGKNGSSYTMHDPIEGPYLRFSDYYSTSAVYQYITFHRS